MPDKIFGSSLILDFIDRCAKLSSLHPPPAALGKEKEALLRCPIKSSHLALILDFIDRCAKLSSLYPPPAALGKEKEALLRCPIKSSDLR